MPQFFGNFGPLLTRLNGFVNEVRKDYRKFQPRIIQQFETEFSQLGAADLNLLYAYLVKRYFPRDEHGTIPIIFRLLYDRHVLRFQQVVHNAFSAALESVPEVPNPNRARIAPGGPQRTIMARLTAAVKGGEPIEPLPKDGGRELYGYMRASRNMRREIKIPLLAYLRMVVRQTPRNFERDFTMLVIRHFSGPAAPVYYMISTGASPRSCTTCRVLNGRVLTDSALQFAVTALLPVLLHPNCVHRIEPMPVGYDLSKVVTIDLLKSWIAAGTLRESATVRTPFVNV